LKFDNWLTKDLRKSIKMLGKWCLKLSRLRYIPVPQKVLGKREPMQTDSKVMEYRRGVLFEAFFQLKLMQEELDKRRGKA
jgi:hypothetical protein